ncbi:hypothetical protein [Posidoniimonas corsicana]|uniref:hypothetical protein n=1 Tax=Posidoniimonas corsicana TaxID=1938618 RepID=UPI0011B621A8|nr:hypothetical protein [Posidoniimonas corsicana]
MATSCRTAPAFLAVPCIAGLAALLYAAPTCAAPVTSFTDIQHWVGEGANQAALIIDWDESPAAGGPLAWGYRWDGQATGRDMLLAVIAADQRVYAKLDAAEVRMYGLGYDANQPESFALSDNSAFDQRGVTQATQSQADGAVATDPLDAYGEGWYLRFWHYASLPSGFDSTWESNQRGFASRELADGAIDGWTFATVFNFTAYPDPAEPAPAVTQPGDYNADGAVNAADYTVWRDGLAAAGAGHDGYELWRDHYGASPTTLSAAAPEPAAALLFLAAGVGLAGRLRFPNPHLGTTS